MEDTAAELSTDSERGDGYVYRVHVSRNKLQYKRSGLNPATLYRHEIDRWTPKRVFVLKGLEQVGDGNAPKYQRRKDGCYSLNREELEQEGKIYHRPARERFYLHRDDAEAIVQSHAPKTPECLEELGLDRSATESDVREVFRIRSKELHPDHGGTKEGFRRLRDAYEDALETV